MSKARIADLGSFIASKKDAMPAPLERESVTVQSPQSPVNDDARSEAQPQPQAIAPVAKPSPPAPAPRNTRAPAKPPEPTPAAEMVMLNVRVTPAFRKELKLYAVGIDKDMSEIVREGVELYRKKHGPAK